MSDKKIANLMPALYSHRLHEIQEIARGCGYAIAVHGSMQRDLDLIAVPWVATADEPIRLIRKLCHGLSVDPQSTTAELRPHGRLVYTLLMGGACFMDLSVMQPDAPAHKS